MADNEEENNLKRLFEQYKLYVEMADRISQRRAQDNRFYITILSGLFVIISLGTKAFQTVSSQILIAVSLFAICICILWYCHIKSYRQLNSGKFKVIQKMEEQLPFPPYKKEWEFLKEGKEPSVYRPMTDVEKILPFLISLPYVILIICAICFPITVTNT